MVLVGRRQLRSNNSWMHNVQVLVKGKDTLHRRSSTPTTPAARARRRRDRHVRSRAGSIDVPVEVTDVVMPGVVCVPHGWGHGLPGTRRRSRAGTPG